MDIPQIREYFREAHIKKWKTGRFHQAWRITLLLELQENIAIIIRYKVRSFLKDLREVWWINYLHNHKKASFFIDEEENSNKGVWGSNTAAANNVPAWLVGEAACRRWST